MTTSKLFKLNLKDYLKGFLMAIITSVITSVYNAIQLGSMVIDYNLIIMSAVGGGLGYLIKNFFTSPPTEEV